MKYRLSPILLVAAVSVTIAAARMGPQGDPSLSAQLDISIARSDTGEETPARVYLFKDGQPFRLSPVDALLPLRVDLFYRERLWRQDPGARAQTLEVTNGADSHFILLDGHGSYDLPAGRYRLEAYRGFCFAPAAEEFELRAGQRHRVELALRPLADGRHGGWLSGDDHIHLTRTAADNDVFLRWLQAEDLSVGNFLQLQRQMDAAVQYGFGRTAEARAAGFSIRSGHESRSDFYGHVNVLGPDRLIRPLSVGTVYANSPEAYPFPAVLFEQGRELGATVGYAHFDGSQKHSTLPMDLALGTIDFVEVFQFGVLKTDPWYQLLNAGFRVTGVAGSDFPANLSQFRPWPRSIPLLGPERTVVRGEAVPAESAYERWAEGVRRGQAVVSNGPLLELSVNGEGPGAVIAWNGESKTVEGTAEAVFYRPIELVEVIANGRVVTARAGDGSQTRLSLPFQLTLNESRWVAARARCRRAEGETRPEIQAHTNPVYVLRDRRPVFNKADRQAVLKRWEGEAEYYKGPALTFAKPEHRQALLEKVDEALRVLRAEPKPWP
jgi:hypothetical protein